MLAYGFLIWWSVPGSQSKIRPNMFPRPWLGLVNYSRSLRVEESRLHASASFHPTKAALQNSYASPGFSRESQWVLGGVSTVPEASMAPAA